MKKILAIFLALSVFLSCAACSSATTKESAAPSEAPAVSGAPATATATSDYEMLPFLENYKEYKQQDSINVLYLVCTTAAEYFVNSYAVWKPMLEEKGIHMDLVGPPTYSDDSLISTLESALASQKYDLILLYPITPSAITPYLDEAWNTYHTPILAYAFSPETNCGNYYLGTSYYAAGTVLGKSIVDYVDKNKSYFDTLDTIPVAVYKNSAGSEQYARVQGALDVLKADGRFSVINEYEANGEATCLTQTETVLTDHPEVEVIIGQIDNDVTGAYQAITSGTYKCSDYLSLWGFDATGAVCDKMYNEGETGCVQGSAFIDHEQAGKALAELIPILVGAAKQQKLIEFTPDEAEQLGTALAKYYVTVTPDNVKDYYTPSAK